MNEPEAQPVSSRCAPLKRLIREPFLHFLLLGAALFALNAWRQQQRSSAPGVARIEVSAAVIERLRAGYERQFNRRPDENDLRGLVAAHIREEVLSREALALGLEREDTIVRRRLAQKMEFLTDDLVGAAEPEPAALQAYFNTNAARYARAGRVSFRHVYFSKEKRGRTLETAAATSLAALQQGGSDEQRGDPFLHGFEFTEREPEEVVALFGRDFATPLAAVSPGEWRGPLPSSYGLHLVRVESRTGPRPVSLAEVREAVVRDFTEERRRAANREIFDRLRERYQVTVDEAAITNAVVRVVAEAGR